MSLDQAALLAEIIGGAAILLTLVFLVLELRRNTAATRSATHQTQVDSTVGLQAMLVNDAALAGIILKANADISSITSEDNLRLQYLYQSHFNLWHSAYWNKREGLLSEHAWHTWDKGMNLILKNQQACRQAWKQGGELYDEDFQAYVDEILESIDSDSERNPGFGGGNAT